MPVDKTETFPGDLPDLEAHITAPPLEPEAPAGALPGTEATIEAESKPILPVFNEKHKLPLEGLLYLGRLEREFSWGGHRFQIKTLTSGDRMQLASLTRPYMGTTEEARAWVTAQAALCVIRVDGHKPVTPMSQDDDVAYEQFQWALRLYPWTIDAIFAHLLDLEAQAKEVADEMEKA